jgi:hypothetical protein
VRLAWQGLLAAAQRQFAPHTDADVQAAFGGEWPIRQIVSALNARYPIPPWSDDRVDNAKKRLKNWINRLAHDHGFDSIDLMALFARGAREHERAAAKPGHFEKREGKSALKDSSND